MDQIMSIPYSNIFSICPKNWEIAPLQEHLFFQEGPGILAKDFRDSGVSLLRLAGVGDKFATLDGCNFLDPEMVDKKWPHFRLDAGDIVTSASASFGRTSIVGKATEGAISYTGIIRFRPRTNKIVPGFIELFLRSPFFENQARSFAVGGVIQHFGPTHLKQMAIALPPIEEQMAISSIIGAFDDKIELNRRMHATLKATAQALFKSWFVDFDPVRAKMEGRAPEGMDEATAALFPDGLEESESDLGRVPRGWKVQSLDEIAEFLNGLALQKFPATDPAGSLPVIKIAELRNGISAKSDRASRDVPEKYIIEDGDFLFSWSGSLLAKFWTEGEGALNQHLFKVTSERYPMWFVSHWVHHHLEEFQSIAASKATTMGHIQRSHLKSAMAICPMDDALKKFDTVMAPFIDASIRNEIESRSLATLRDTLLSKLLRGELRVAQAEKEIFA
ncbi:restriction endonuclease subunit S [Verminephrobacter eiseniae]|nr:restriction endonuclease subunit S [Verminephrobacter eiseniae]MCW5292511.1 restriction endonuclease subunit S [Verminephrobacter eiseniae]MCW8186093.1 restriction endonuclease subunit S [Verminephrobacter eiseniae]MCW8223485.1 restriction endonuclease subunit S [Verminephrobacter eiseniae]MCW8233702.1 restriction endonuclease subunit S [Verminephrobacter eiseniae]